MPAAWASFALLKSAAHSKRRKLSDVALFEMVVEEVNIGCSKNTLQASELPSARQALDTNSIDAAIPANLQVMVPSELSAID